MRKKELEFILQEGEGLKIEFKESTGNIGKEAVALANSTGGRVFLGITDDNKIKGRNITNRLKPEIHDCTFALMKKIPEFKEDEKVDFP
ncbi:hypothetical protein GF323_01485 [Candidatus Woesearchaeota archaeon]|nr:hypothetical protein [Candidatus Woesearchaeota archaeon]